MNIDLQTVAAISVLTGLTTEAIKGFCKMTEKPYISNIIAAVVAVALSFVAVVLFPVVYHWQDITPELIMNGVVVAFFSVLSATLGFDKIVQTLNKLKE